MTSNVIHSRQNGINFSEVALSILDDMATPRKALPSRGNTLSWAHHKDTGGCNYYIQYVYNVCIQPFGLPK